MLLTRRSLALTGLAAASMGALAPAAQARLPIYAGAQRPRLIPGDPAHIDFGHGLVLPATNALWSTLWEGDDRYLTFGRASSIADIRARAQAELAAEGTMRLMLITLAFAPQRLARFENCGWRSASGSVHDLVMGEVRLPGRSYLPEVEAPNGASPDNLISMSGLLQAMCVYVVLKQQVGLDYVRHNALLVCTGGSQPAPGGDPAMAAREVCPTSGSIRRLPRGR